MLLLVIAFGSLARVGLPILWQWVDRLLVDVTHVPIVVTVTFSYDSPVFRAKDFFTHVVVVLVFAGPHELPILLSLVFVAVVRHVNFLRVVARVAKITAR